MEISNSEIAGHIAKRSGHIQIFGKYHNRKSKDILRNCWKYFVLMKISCKEIIGHIMNNRRTYEDVGTYQHRNLMQDYEHLRTYSDLGKYQNRKSDEIL